MKPQKFICTTCYEEKQDSERWKPNQRKCIKCKRAYQKEHNQKTYRLRGENEPAWSVTLSDKWRTIYEQRQLAETEESLISSILRILG